MRIRRSLRIVYILGLVGLVCSCVNKKSGDDESEKSVVETSGNVGTTVVTTIKLESEIFTYDLVSNGKVMASNNVDLQFGNSTAIVDRIFVKNGQRVSKGAKLATLDTFSLNNTLVKARNNLERARLDLADALISQGYDPERMASIPEDVVRLARLRCGILQLEIALKEAERALAEATLRAPYDGVVANLYQKVGNRPDAGQPFCRIIGSSGMDVTFPVLESELSLIREGEKVEVKLYSTDKTYYGSVTNVNPIVDKDGMVKVTARIHGGNGLFEGMNVRICVKRNVAESLVVPKSAVVLRSGGRKVVFTVEDGKAVWNYVSTSLENMNNYVITDGLQEGQEVIVSGNLNMADGNPVKVKNN